MSDWSVKALGLPEIFLMQNQGGAVINQSTTENILLVVHAAKRKKMNELGL